MNATSLRFASPIKLYRASHGFSLVELLAVMAILSILGVISVGVLRSAKGTKLTTGGRTMVNLISLARAEAITRGTFTRFHVAEGDPQNAGICRASIWAYTDRELPASDLLAWTQISNWEKVDDGISVTADPNSSTALPGTYLFDLSPQLNVPGPTGTVSTRYLQFTPNGSLQTPSSANSPARIRLTDGSDANWLDIGVDNLTGRVKVTRPGEST